MNRREGGWSVRQPPSGQDSAGERSEAEVPGAGTARVISLGALCDLDETAQDDRSQSFKVSEFALLEDDQRIILHSDCGFTLGWGSGSPIPGDISTGESEATLARNVLNVVLPDPDNGEEHPWSWLADLAQSRGLNVTASTLRELPYAVFFTDRVRGWLASA